MRSLTTFCYDLENALPSSGEKRRGKKHDGLDPLGPDLHVAARFGRALADNARFIGTWFNKPLLTGAVVPSGADLARMMALYVDPDLSGPVIELGPGTGVITDALLERGIAEERLILIEFDPDFCELLRQRFPKALVLQGDAYTLQKTIDPRFAGKVAAIVSGLPLFTKPESMRLRLLRDAFNMLQKGAPFIQFTYAVISPIPLRARGFIAERSSRVWRNVPPARVWVYRRFDGPHIRQTRRSALALIRRIRERTDRLGSDLRSKVISKLPQS